MKRMVARDEESEPGLMEPLHSRVTHGLSLLHSTYFYRLLLFPSISDLILPFFLHFCSASCPFSQEGPEPALETISTTW